MELRRIVWEWDSALARLAGEQPDLAAALARSCRPLAAERRPGGQLRLILGCWWEPDLRWLRQPAIEVGLDQALSAVLTDQLKARLEIWPGGMASVGDAEQVQPPDVLAGLPRAARIAASGCESALQRHFYAEAYRRGIRLHCQYQVLTYRLDFALPSEHLGAEVEGWERPKGWRGRPLSGEREQHLGASGWRMLRFWGKEVLDDVAGCVRELQETLGSTR